MKCDRCEQYPCRCADSRDVIAEYHTRSRPRNPVVHNDVAGLLIGCVLGAIGTVLILGFVGLLP